MIICLGPICFPIWHLLPVLLLLFTKAKALWYWMLGKPMPSSDQDTKKTDGPPASKAITSSSDVSGTLRKRKAEGVIALQTIEEWKEIIQVSENGFPRLTSIVPLCRTTLYHFLR